MQGAVSIATQVVSAASSYWWAIPLVLIISLVAASALSLVSIRTNRAIARKRATLDMIERSESQPWYRDLYENFQSVRNDKGGFGQLINPTNPTLKKQRDDVNAFLNHYELVAIGCRTDVLDKEFYKLWMHRIFVRDFEAAEMFIKSIRNPEKYNAEGLGNPKAFIEFEALAREWGAQEQLDLSLPENSNSN